MAEGAGAGNPKPISVQAGHKRLSVVPQPPSTTYELRESEHRQRLCDHSRALPVPSELKRTSWNPEVIESICGTRSLWIVD